MNRRRFLAGLASLPAAPMLPKVAVAAAPFAGIGKRACDVLAEAMDRIVNPPLLIDANGNITPLFAAQYREEFIAAFEQRQTLLREIAKEWDS